MSQQIQITNEELQNIKKEYDFNTEDMFSSFDDDFRNIAIATKQLPLPDYIILLLYAHFESQRKVGRVLGVSHSIVGKELKRIRAEIFDILNGE